MSAAYRPRVLRFLDVRAQGAWRMKMYSISMEGEAVREALVSATEARAWVVLPEAAFESGRHGVGFTISHDANGVCFGLVYWWEGENELHQRLFMAPKEAPGDLTPIAHPAAGCVWELEIIDFERRAWLADMLANPSGVVLEAYLGRGFSGVV